MSVRPYGRGEFAALPRKDTVPRRALLITSLTILVAAAAPGQASASAMNGFGNYDGDPGPNIVTASFDGTYTTITDTGGITLSPDSTDPERGACVANSATSVRCSYANGYNLQLEGGNDSFSYTGFAPPTSAPGGKLFSVQGGHGVDVISGSPYNDDLAGDGQFDGTPDPAGNDQISGNGGNDDLRDNDGSNRFDGGPGNDKVLPNGIGADTVDGGDGDDFLGGGDGNDIVRGGAGKDDVEGGGGDDTADGGPGDDLVQASFHGGGCGDAEILIGGAGRDALYAACAAPAILKLRDGEKDTGRCLPKVTAATVEFDKKLDQIEGGACERSSCGKKGKKKKGGAAAAKKKKGCRKKGRRK